MHSQLKTIRQIRLTDAMQLRYPIIKPPVSILKHRNFSIANIIFASKENIYEKFINEIFLAPPWQCQVSNCSLENFHLEKNFAQNSLKRRKMKWKLRESVRDKNCFIFIRKHLGEKNKKLHGLGIIWWFYLNLFFMDFS